MSTSVVSDHSAVVNQSRFALLCPSRCRPITAGSGAFVELVEKANEGAARVRVQLPPTATGYVFDLSRATAVEILRDQQNCDGSVLVTDSTGCYACVVEIKRTLSMSTWEKAQKQLRSGAIRLQLVLSFLDVSPSRWIGAVVCGEDRTQPQRNPDPALLHRPVGKAMAPKSLYGAKIHVQELGAMIEVRKFVLPITGGAAELTGDISLF